MVGPQFAGTSKAYQSSVSPSGVHPASWTSSDAHWRLGTACAAAALSFGSTSVTVPHANGSAALGSTHRLSTPLQACPSGQASSGPHT